MFIIKVSSKGLTILKIRTFAKVTCQIIFMIRGFLKESSFVVRILFLILVFFFFSLLGVILGGILVSGDIDNLRSIQILQIIQSVFTFIIPPFVVAYLWSDDKPYRYFQLDKSVSFKSILFVILFMLLIIPFINLLSDLNQQIVLPEFMSGFEEDLKLKEAQATELTEQLLNVNTISGLFFNIFLIAILPAFSEELLFRGTLQRVFTDWQGAVLAIWLSAFIFSVFHFQFYGFIPRILLGAVFGYFLFWSKSLWLPIIAHFVNNCIIVVYKYLQYNEINLKIDLDTIGANDTWWIGCLSGVIFVGGFLFFRKHLTRQKEKPHSVE